jgi:hypothetical protein
VAGVSGWSIGRDGTAEFSDAVIRGSFVISGSGGSEILAQSQAGQPQISFEPAALSGETILPGLIIASSQDGIIPKSTELVISSPYFLAGTSASVSLESDKTGTALSRVTVDAERIDLQTTASLIRISSADTILISTVNGMVDADGMSYLRGQMGLTTLALLNTDTLKATGTINFPIAFPAGVTPKMFANNTNSAGGTTNWDAHCVNITNTGFQVIMRGTAGTAFTANIQWTAFYPV